MKSLQRARRHGRILRTKVGLSADGLLDRLITYLWDQYRVQVRPATKAKLQGSRAELRGRTIFYEKDLTLGDLLLILAHELGHIVLHRWRIFRLHALDPIRAASYLVHEKGPALARYSPKTREEMEATAFAVEFLCPSDLIFERWWRHEGTTSQTLADELGVGVEVVRAQLVEALYHIVIGRTRHTRGRSRRFDPDDAQWEAIQHEVGPALVDAGAGTGKTATLVERVAYLLQREVEQKQRPAPEVASQFLILTFSNEAVAELISRLEARVGEEAAAEMTVATFHGFGYEFLHRHRHLLGLPTELRVLDDVVQKERILHVIGESSQPILDLRDPQQTAAEAARHINYLKQRLAVTGTELQPWTPSLLRMWLDESPDHPQEVLYRAYALCGLFEAYEDAKKGEGAVDFADLISLPIQLLRTQPDIAKLYHDTYRHVLVDEFQDVSKAVALLLSLLASSQSSPWVVGDARQAIYRFQGAAPDNVTDFRRHFPNSTVFSLNRNYRSCKEIVAAANQLATLMMQSGKAISVPQEIWKPSTDEEALEEPAVRVVVANSDKAERAGIADQVERWIKAGVKPHEIAVLARRNVDVLNILLALGERGVRAVAPGLVTPEGAAGDLAVVATVADKPRASLPRLTYALGRSHYDAEELDRVVAKLRTLIQDDGTILVDDLETDEPGVLFEVIRVIERLRAERFSADAFSMMTAFLFDASPYLRRLLGRWESLPDAASDVVVQIGQVATSLKLSQTLTALSRSAADRFSRRKSKPWEARLRFADYFRRSLSDATPSSLPPQPVEGAVQVMTCHAAKGLQFPCVIVAGQTLSRMKGTYEWLPEALQPSAEEDREQANAVLFVGVTRAQRVAVVSYATSAGGSARPQDQRKLPPLLEHWIEAFNVPTDHWPEHEPFRPTASFDSVWGRPQLARISARTLDPSWCTLRTYVEDLLKLGLPEGDSSLYPRFFEAVRKAMNFVVGEAQRRDDRIAADEAEAALKRVWQTYNVQEHPHGTLYYAVGREHVRGLAEVYVPDGSGYHPLERERIKSIQAPNLGVRLSLVDMFYGASGIPVAILYRPESYEDKAKGETINWSKLSTAKRLPFVLLRESFPELIPYIFSGRDGRFYRFIWSQRSDSMTKEFGKATTRLQRLAEGRYEKEISEWACDRCPARISCPHWLRTSS